jgi:hypothetical protein
MNNNKISHHGLMNSQILNIFIAMNHYKKVYNGGNFIATVDTETANIKVNCGGCNANCSGYKTAAKCSSGAYSSILF